MADFFDDLVYSKEDIITFPAGIPGFENNKQFILLQVPDLNPFEWLACIDGSQLRFVVVNPMLFMPEYAPDVKKEQLAELEIDNPEDVLLYSVVTIKENPAESTANLVGPIVINKTKNIAKQVIIEDDRYSTQEPILRKK
ncbi:MAG: flagellar assembly protein FliW [Chitinivibrionales bacterium]|nr:flagellar assembly protein FliW [Chitinivibrionales bacterium]